ncbi:hypothetical protein ACS0TY_011229 [Phlomoides rotata]
MRFIIARFFRWRIVRSQYITSSVWKGLYPQVQKISMRFWLDNWLGYVIGDRNGIPYFVREFLEFSVLDYFYEDTWHLDVFFVMKHLNIVEDILRYTCEADHDTLIWPFTIHGDLNAKMTYNNIQAKFPKVTWGKWLWDSFIPVKRSMNVWRIIQGKLSTSDYLRRRGFSGPSCCAHCKCDEEELDHILCHCNWTQQLMRQVFCIFNCNINMDFGLDSWLLQVMAMQFSPHVKAIWRLSIITGLWLLWESRNNAIFKDTQPHLSQISAMLCALIKEGDSAQLGYMHNTPFDLAVLASFGISGWPTKAPSIKNIRWQCPPPSFMKVNVDGGATRAPGLLTGGGVFKDNFGIFRGAFTM